MGRPAVPPGGFRNIAVLRLSSLGDVILTLPVVRALGTAFPGARLSVWTREEYAEVVRFEPAVHHVRALEREASGIEDLVSMSAELEDCDLIVDLHGSLRTRVLCWRQKAVLLRAPSSRLQRARWVHARWTRPAPARHALERYAAALRPIGLAAPGSPTVTAGAAAEAWAEDWLAGWGRDARPVALCPGARHFTKRWPEAHWLRLDATLAARGRPRLYLSLDAERRALGTLAHATERVPGARWMTGSLARIAALMSRCAVAVSGDTGLMHLAAARGLPVVAMFGSTAPELGFAPSGPGHEVLCRHERCQPCTIHGRERCPKGHFRCMEGITPEQVVEALVDRARTG